MVSAFSIPKAPRDQKQPKRPGPGQYQYFLIEIVQKHLLDHINPKILVIGPEYLIQFQPMRSRKVEQWSWTWRILNKISLISKKFSKLLYKTSIKTIESSFQFRTHSLFTQFEPYKSLALLLVLPSQTRIRTKLPLREPEGPGPGNYNMPQIQKKGYHIGKESKFYQSGNKVPGPGSYRTQQISIKCKTIYDPKYSFRMRGPDIVSLVPGPGQYSPANQTYSKQGGIISKDIIQFNMTCKSPGITNYQQNAQTKKKSPSWFIPKVKKGTQFNMFNNEPEKHTINRSLTHKFQTLYPKQQPVIRQTSESGIEQKPTDVKRRKYQINIQLQTPIDEQIFGLQLHDSTRIMRQTWLTGKGKYRGQQVRLKNTITITPGPGAYDHSSPDGHSYSPVMGKDQKLKPIKSVAPGPGHYILQPTFADVPKYLLQRR